MQKEVKTHHKHPSIDQPADNLFLRLANRVIKQQQQCIRLLKSQNSRHIRQMSMVPAKSDNLFNIRGQHYDHLQQYYWLTNGSSQKEQRRQNCMRVVAVSPDSLDRRERHRIREKMLHPKRL